MFRVSVFFSYVLEFGFKGPMMWVQCGAVRANVVVLPFPPVRCHYQLFAGQASRTSAMQHVALMIS